MAERAVQEVTAQLRCLKLGLESRIKVPLRHYWRVTDSMVEHASYLINRCLRGADGKTPLKRLKGYEPNKHMVEFGEQVWAKPLRTQAWRKREPLESKWNAATWLGVSARTGEHLVILPNDGPLRG